MQNRYFTLLMATILLVSCSKKTDSILDPFDPSIQKEMMNESYGTLKENKADIYLPANRKSATTKCLILIHGGSWVTGDKADLALVLPVLKNAMPEAAIINMNYTLADGKPATQLPAQMNDIATLLTFLASKSSLWNISASYTLVGVSAGGHLAMLYTYAYDKEKKIKLVASIVGPTNLEDPFYTGNPLFQQVLTPLAGKTYTEDPALYRSISPAWRVTNTAPPTYLAYGGLDPLVPISNPTLLIEKLQANQVKYKYDFLPQEGHEFTNTATIATAASLSSFWRQFVP